MENKQEEIVIRKIGKCPVCGKGEMVEGSAGYTCDYFVSMQEKCRFTIFKEYHGHKITEEEAKMLIETGETAPIDFISREGTPFTAKLKVSDGVVKTVYDEHILDCVCPLCGGKVKELKNGYACENFIKDKDGGKCEFYVGKTICGREISGEETERFAREGKIVLDGFISKTGKSFSSILDIVDGKVWLNSEICTCPKCGGKIHIGIKAYNCSNFRDDNIKCDFVIWRNMAGRDINPSIVKQLCEKGETEVLSFRNKEGEEFTRKLILNEEKKVVMA